MALTMLYWRKEPWRGHTSDKRAFHPYFLPQSSPWLESVAGSLCVWVWGRVEISLHNMMFFSLFIWKAGNKAWMNSWLLAWAAGSLATNTEPPKNPLLGIGPADAVIHRWKEEVGERKTERLDKCVKARQQREIKKKDSKVKEVAENQVWVSEMCSRRWRENVNEREKQRRKKKEGKMERHTWKTTNLADRADWWRRARGRWVAVIEGECSQ